MIDSNAEALSANSSSLLKQSLWCGAVCAVAIVLTSLNLCPPVDVKYKVTTRVVVSKHRLEQLKSTLERDRKIIATGKLRYVQLYSLKLLDEVERDGLLLVELESLWTGRASPTHIETWLTKVSQTDPSKLIASDEARTERFARWEAETAKHYLKHHRFVCVNADVELDATEQIAKEPASSSGIPAKFASTITTDAVPAKLVSGQLDFDDPVVVEKKLSESVKQAEASVAKSQKAFHSALERHAGAIEVVGKPRIRSKTSSIPTWMSASVIILAIATGSIASLLQYRAQSGGAFDPQTVARQLRLEGLPIVAEVSLPALASSASVGPTAGWLSSLKYAAGMHMAKFGEGLMLLWCVVITCRIVFDPLWRNVVIDSPLAAFGRLVSGMP